MRSLGLFSQVLAVIIAITIGYFYVQPTVDEIGQIQTDTAEYASERKEIETINAQLAGDLATYQSISPTDKMLLDTYMPESIDDISIMRDISYIIEQANVTNTVLSYDGPVDSERSILSPDANSNSALAERSATAHGFTVGLNGSYAEVKDFLSLLEQNEYPLEVHQMSLAADQSGRINASVTLVSYVHETTLVNAN